MDILYIVLAFILAFIGILGSVVPVLPGPPLSYVALLLLYFCNGAEVSVTTLVIMGVVMAVITIVDYIAPAWMTKLKGGSKSASNGAIVGTIVGLFFGPVGVIVGPFLGAFIGEIIANSSKGKAFNVALMSFLAFILTSGVKLIYGIAVMVMLIIEAIDIFAAMF
ncbi:MAG: DUF456 domain-containing protein [Bacteroidales bacterium]|nr:DUF456 domain-containing protein [Bacteroidales bacterium]